MAIKIGLIDAPPLYAASLRFALAVAILYAIILLKRYSLPEGAWQTLRLAYPGLYMYGACYALIYFAEQYISSALTSVLFASFPLFVAFLSTWMLRAERLQLPAWFGLGLGFVGIVVISYDSLHSSGDLFLGTMLALGGSLTAAYGMLIHKKHFASRNITVAATVQMTLGGMPLLVAALVFERLSDFSVTPASIGSILYLATLGTVIAFVAYYWLLSRAKAVVVSLIAFITPIVAIFLGVFWGESLSLRTLVGTIMILTGVLLVVRK